MLAPPWHGLPFFSNDGPTLLSQVFTRWKAIHATFYLQAWEHHGASLPSFTGEAGQQVVHRAYEVSAYRRGHASPY